jgi:RimJ/RimL family protein N-acetyltransferase
MGLAVPILSGRWVRLEPLGEAHREGLRPAADDPRLWEHTLTRGDGPHFDGWFADALARRAAGSAYPFAVRRVDDGRPVGSTSYLDIALSDRRIEIGSTWYVPALWGTRVNPECKLLLLAHAFEVLGVNRVALVRDARNERSQRAIAKLGAVREGVLRAHRITQGGRVRDTVVFSIIAPEWPAVRDRLAARLAGE